MAGGGNTRGTLFAPLAVGWRAAANTRITRRGFLAGGATTPIAYKTAFATGIDREAVLEFDLSDDRASVVVRPSYRIGGGASSGGPPPWLIEAASFGPDSWFEMHAADGPLGRRLLNVRDASYGAATGLTLSFVFTPTSSSSSGDEPPPYPISWTLRIETPLWAAFGVASARWSSGEVDFVEFVESGTPLEGSAPGRPVGDRLSEMFDDRVDTDRKSSILLRSPRRA
jgi:hypothetical protein